MTTYFTINNRRYEARDFDFNLVCDLQDMKIDVTDFESLSYKSIAAVRAYIALCMNVDVNTAGEEIQKHIIDGGDIGEVSSIMRTKMEESDFFRAISEDETEEAPENQTEKKAKGKSEK